MRVSLRALVVAVSYCTVLFAAALNNSPASVILLCGIALASLPFALLAVWYRSERRRAYWIGYLHGGLAYALLTFYSLGGIADRPLWNDSVIISGELANQIYPAVTAAHGWTWRATPDGPQRLKTTASRPALRYLFHSTFIMLFGWIGGQAGAWLFDSRAERKAKTAAQTDDLKVTEESLLTIVRTSPITGADTRRKGAALRRLRMFVDSESTVAVLLEEIAFRQEGSHTSNSPLADFPAAESLACGGAIARAALISETFGRFMSDREIALRAHILASIDRDRDVLAFRLKRALERSPEDPTANPDPESLVNLRRILAYIEDPAFAAHRAIPDPLDEAG